jgi:hypothetical protein
MEKSSILVTERPKSSEQQTSRTMCNVLSDCLLLDDYSSKDLKQDLSRLLVKGKGNADDDKFEIQIAVLRKISNALHFLDTIEFIYIDSYFI